MPDVAADDRSITAEFCAARPALTALPAQHHAASNVRSFADSVVQREIRHNSDIARLARRLAARHTARNPLHQRRSDPLLDPRIKLGRHEQDLCFRPARSLWVNHPSDGMAKAIVKIIAYHLWL